MPSFRMYRDSRNEWRWRFLAGNGLTIAVSSEGYKNETDCLHAINLVKNSGSAQVYYDP